MPWPPRRSPRRSPACPWLQEVYHQIVKEGTPLWRRLKHVGLICNRLAVELHFNKATLALNSKFLVVVGAVAVEDVIQVGRAAGGLRGGLRRGLAGNARGQGQVGQPACLPAAVMRTRPACLVPPAPCCPDPPPCDSAAACTAPDEAV